AVVDVGDNGDVAQLFGHGKGRCTGPGDLASGYVAVPNELGLYVFGRRPSQIFAMIITRRVLNTPTTQS
ncbi:MAG: hypothetical protein AAF788_07275, partial [Pseudomonadota bacterium]